MQNGSVWLISFSACIIEYSCEYALNTLTKRSLVYRICIKSLIAGFIGLLDSFIRSDHNDSDVSIKIRRQLMSESMIVLCRIRDSKHSA